MFAVADTEERLPELLEPLLRAPARAAILCDVDGTLAPIVADPAAAAVPPETTELLRALADRYALVACVSGRPALVAREMVGVPDIHYAGNHGLEMLAPRAGVPALDPELRPRAGAARAFLERRGAGPVQGAGLMVEDKGPIQAIHWRLADDREAAAAAARAIAADAAKAGLAVHFGRRVLELRPPVSIDKGTATRALLRRHPEVRSALFGGDDRTDLDAMSALAGMVAENDLDAAVRIGVTSDEAPAELAEATDLLVAGTLGFAGVLRRLVEG
jgi:trehalose 6-phosphate phosphatase